MMGKGYLYWWGLRLRIPPDFEFKPVTRLESIILSSLVGVIFEWMWLTIVVFSNGQQPLGIQSAFRWGLLIPVLLLGIPLSCGIALPLKFLDALYVSPWLVFSRQKGRLSKWSLWMGGLSLILGALALFHLEGGLRITSLIFFASIILFCILIFLPGEKLDLSKQRWQIQIPDWLRVKKEGGEEETTEDNILGPDPEASPIYDILTGDGTKYQVGIRIPAELIEKLRTINAEHKGILYQSDSEAVVLFDRPPVVGIGREEIVRFCGQITSLATAKGVTQFQFANLILNFVQRAIKYQFDKDSTGEFPGGPYKEYGRFALESLHDGVGDCECTSLLCLSLLAYMGFKPALLFVTIKEPDTGDSTCHAAVGIDAEGLFMPSESVLAGIEYIESTDESGRRYLYGETAVDGDSMAFGIIPPSWKDFMTIDKVIPIPVPELRDV